jgi:CheY-like chemotaxis protein
MKTKGRSEPRILIADDDTSIRQLLTTIVKRERLIADSASDGEDAIRKLQEHEYSVILLDLMMPHVDGFGVIDYLRDHPQSVKPVVLVITAYADQKFKLVDPDVVAGVIRKPFEIAELGSLVRLCAIALDEQFPDRVARPLPASGPSARESVN